jgi:hypothetical protein
VRRSRTSISGKHNRDDAIQARLLECSTTVNLIASGIKSSTLCDISKLMPIAGVIFKSLGSNFISRAMPRSRGLKLAIIVECIGMWGQNIKSLMFKTDTDFADYCIILLVFYRLLMIPLKAKKAPLVKSENQLRLERY